MAISHTDQMARTLRARVREGKAEPEVAASIADVLCRMDEAQHKLICAKSALNSAQTQLELRQNEFEAARDVMSTLYDRLRWAQPGGR